MGNRDKTSSLKGKVVTLSYFRKSILFTNLYKSFSFTLIQYSIVSDNGCHTSGSEFQSAEDILDNVLASAGCKEFFNSDSNILESNFDFLPENSSDSIMTGYFCDSPLISEKVSIHHAVFLIMFLLIIFYLIFMKTFT